jgi:maltooligosyltrehalose trehalohydrolase
VKRPLGAVAGAGFSVWAPAASEVELVLPDRVVVMTARAFGWWTTDDVTATEGLRYGYRLDGGPVLPDPRSGSQPDGVHGWSAVVDHTTYRWHDDGFEPVPLGDAVIYELHVGTFTAGGRYRDVVDRLPALAELGVTHVELMPVAAFPGRHGWGYDGVALYAPHAPYGPPDDLRGLVDAAHGLDLAVILDVVYNHFGPEGNHLAPFGPYLTDAVATPWGDAINLDGPGSDEVRSFFVDNAVAWLAHYHLDGLRLDAVHALHDGSARHLLEDLAAAVAAHGIATGRRAVLVAESDRNDPRTVAAAPAGWGLDAQWADDLHHGLHVALTGERDGYYADYVGLDDVATALAAGFVYAGRYSVARDRTVGRPLTDFDLGDRPADRLVTCLENHDQIGNRANGDRLHHVAGIDRLLVGATLALTAPTVPMLFQGEEWAASAPFPFFADHGDPELVDAVRAGRLAEFAEFGWDASSIPDPEDAATRDLAVLDWDERSAPEHRRVLDHYRALLSLRRDERDLRSGRFVDRVTVAAGGRSIVVERGRVVVAANLDDDPTKVDLDGTMLLATDGSVRLEHGCLQLPACSAAVLRRAPSGERA